MRRMVLAITLIAVALVDGTIRAATIQFLTPGGSSAGIAYGVDGLNVVGQDVAQRGFLYNGATKTYSVIKPPSSGSTSAQGISGNKIVGWYVASEGIRGFLYDGSTYTKLSHPLGANGTNAWDIDGNNIVGWYQDAAKVAHGFLFDGTNYTTIDYPGAITTSVFSVSGTNVVGSYKDSSNRTHGFLFNGSTYTTIDDPFYLGTGTNAALGIDGNKIVGRSISLVASVVYIYDGINFSHPFGSETNPNHAFFGISGNRIVGEYNDRPFVYIVPEPSSLALASLAAGSLSFFRRQRTRASSRFC
jgi:hypothetical protein